MPLAWRLERTVHGALPASSRPLLVHEAPVDAPKPGCWTASVRPCGTRHYGRRTEGAGALALTQSRRG
jgi:hypothetical protein